MTHHYDTQLYSTSLRYFAQPSRYACEPPPGATGVASSTDGVHWERALEVPMMDTYPAHGAKPWEQTQQYAHYLLYVRYES